jgi:hypothetical protein
MAIADKRFQQHGANDEARMEGAESFLAGSTEINE